MLHIARLRITFGDLGKYPPAELCTDPIRLLISRSFARRATLGREQQQREFARSKNRVQYAHRINTVALMVRTTTTHIDRALVDLDRELASGLQPADVIFDIGPRSTTAPPTILRAELVRCAGSSMKQFHRNRNDRVP